MEWIVISQEGQMHTLSYLPLCKPFAVLCKYFMERLWLNRWKIPEKERDTHRAGEAWKLCVQMINTYLILVCIVRAYF